MHLQYRYTLPSPPARIFPSPPNNTVPVTARTMVLVLLPNSIVLYYDIRNVIVWYSGYREREKSALAVHMRTYNLL